MQITARTAIQDQVDEHAHRVFNVALESRQQLGTERPVHTPVIGGERDGHDGCDGQCAVLDDRALFTRTDSQDSGVRRIDDSREVLDTHHAHVGHGRRATLVFLRLQLLGLRAGAHVLHLVGDDRQRLFLARRMIGVIKPPGIDTATPTSACLCLTMLSSVQDTFASGTSRSAKRQRLDGHVVDRQLVGRLAVFIG
jgi:hypothetical protein